MLFLFTGNGKGKTTSALGQALRVLGNGGRVYVFQFIKSPNWVTGEELALKKFGPKCKIYKGGLGFVGIMGDNLPRSVHKKAASKTWQKAKRYITSGKFDLIVLDEINVALNLKLLTLKQVMQFLKTIKKDIKTDIILTGRSAPKELIKIADLVTEFKDVRHPFQKGSWGSKGREY